MKFKVGFIGCGNMGGALLDAIQSKIGANNCAVSEACPEKAEKFVNMGVTFLNIEDLANTCEYIFLAVKPQVMESVIKSISCCIKENANVKLVTMAAGLEIKTIESYLGFKCPIIRIMPNIPCSVGSGVLVYCYNDLVNKSSINEFTSIISEVGLVDEISEDKIDITTIISGSGPAFMYTFIDAFSKSAEKFGLPLEKAILYTLKTMEGASKIVETSSTPIETLIKNVCSPKGTTIEGINCLNENDIYSIIDKTVSVSYKRALELKENK